MRVQKPELPVVRAVPWDAHHFAGAGFPIPKTQAPHPPRSWRVEWWKCSFDSFRDTYPAACGVIVLPYESLDPKKS